MDAQPFADRFSAGTKRFNDVFNIQHDPEDKDARELYVAGNHDIGFGNTIILNSYERYERYYGPTSYHRRFGNISVIVLDTISMSMDADRKYRQKTELFLQQLSGG
jgi:hypothetical protein